MLANAESRSAREALTAALVRSGQGDRAAFRQVYEATAAKLFGVILRICRDREVAEEVLQEVFVAVWRRADRYDPVRGVSPITWLCAIARNRAIDRARTLGRRAPDRPLDEAAEISDARPLADAAVERSEEHARLERCLDELEPKHAQAVRTAFFDGLTYESLAEAFGVPLGTMKSWIRRSLIRLKDCLEP
jgi:RNA polymerase sigma-70 factor (ECF subfamily)